MGGLCTKAEVKEPTLAERNERTARSIFDRFDKDKSGYISKENLQQIIQDDKAFRNTDVEHILSKFGDDGKLSFEQFKFWWNSTYTTYNDDNIKQIMDELDAEGAGVVEPSPPRSMGGDKAAKNVHMSHKLEESRS